MKHVQQTLGISERRACQVIGQPRSSQRFTASRPERDRALTDRMHELARRNPRRGYRYIWALLRREAWCVNRKRVQRLWRQEGLRVPQVQRKRRRLGSSENGSERQQAEYKNHVWSYDFVMDQTEDGNRLKLLPILDEFTREVHGIMTARSIVAEDVVEQLAYLFRVHGEPEFIRSDNGPEFIAHAVRDWLAASGVKTLFIEPGSPWQNAYSESFNSRLRQELLNQELFTSLTEAQILVEQHRISHNHERPHSSLGWRTPAEFAAGLDSNGRAPRGFAASAPWKDAQTLKNEPTHVLS